MDWNRIVARVTRLAKMDWSVFEEIEHDESANGEAAAIVLVVAFLSAVGAGLSGRGLLGFVVTLIATALLNWLLWSFVTQLVGTKVFGGEATFWEMARTIGYANVPGVLGVLGVIPCVGRLIGVVTLVLSLILGFFAVREALDLPSDKTIITIVIGWVIVVIAYVGLMVTGLIF